MFATKGENGIAETSEVRCLCRIEVNIPAMAQISI